jgi:membrane-associated phospholipid phosphatase
MTSALESQQNTVPAATGHEGRRAQRRGRLPLAVAILALLGFVLVMVLVALGDTVAFDVRATVTWQRVENPALLKLMIAVSWFGFAPQDYILGAGILALLLAMRLRLEAAFGLLAFASTLLDGYLKELVHRQRPDAGLGGIIVRSTVGGYSFPSGHVLTYVVFLGYLAYLAYTLIHQRALRFALLTFLLGLIALIGPSRVYLGQHWFTDTLGSYLLGTTLLIGLLSLYRAAKARQLATVQASRDAAAERQVMR